MLYVILRGRLGNNLFQIATAASLTQNFIFCTVNKDQERQVLLYKDSFFKNIKVMKGVPDGIPYYKNHSMNLAEFLMKKERISLLMDISNQKSTLKEVSY